MSKPISTGSISGNVKLWRKSLLIWLFDETNRATDVALLGFFAFVPYVLVSPIAGVWVDRLDRRKIMVLADLGAGMGLMFLGTAVFGTTISIAGYLFRPIRNVEADLPDHDVGQVLTV